MGKKDYFAIIEVVATVENTAADFCVVICDRKGIVHNQCAIVVKDEFFKKQFAIGSNARGGYGSSLTQPNKLYEEMLSNGTRMIASTNAANKWISQVIERYQPMLCTYELFEIKIICSNTGIDISKFKEEYSIFDAAIENLFHRNDRINKILSSFSDASSPSKDAAENLREEIKNEFNKITGISLASHYSALEDIYNFSLPLMLNVAKKSKWKERTKNALNSRIT